MVYSSLLDFPFYLYLTAGGILVIFHNRLKIPTSTQQQPKRIYLVLEAFRKYKVCMQNQCRSRMKHLLIPSYSVSAWTRREGCPGKGRQ